MSDVDALRALNQRYSRAIDVRDMGELTALFDPADRSTARSGSSSVPDYLEMTRTLRRCSSRACTCSATHSSNTTEGSDTARLDTYAVVYQLGRVEGGDDMVLGIRYLDDVRRIDGKWRIHHRQAVMLWARDKL